MFRKIYAVIVVVCMFVTFAGCSDLAEYSELVRFENPVPTVSTEPAENVVEPDVEPAAELEDVYDYVKTDYKPGDIVWCVWPADEENPASAVQYMVLATFDDCVIVSSHFFEWETNVDGMLDEMLTRTSKRYSSHVFAYRYTDCYEDQYSANIAAKVANGHYD